MWSIVHPRRSSQWRPFVRRIVLALAVVTTGAAGAAPAQLVPLVVRGVHFKGNHGVDPDLLAASIATTESSFFARSAMVRWMGLGQKRYFNENDFRADVLRLSIVFKRSGYPDVQVDTTVRRSPGAIDVTFDIKEGPPVYLRSLRITGLDSVANAWQVRQDLPIAPGDVASDYLLHETQDTVQQRLRNRGYPAATVELVEAQGHVAQPDAHLIAHPGATRPFRRDPGQRGRRRRHRVRVVADHGASGQSLSGQGDRRVATRPVSVRPVPLRDRRH